MSSETETKTSGSAVNPGIIWAYVITTFLVLGSTAVVVLVIRRALAKRRLNAQRRLPASNSRRDNETGFAHRQAPLTFAALRRDEEEAIDIPMASPAAPEPAFLRPGADGSTRFSRMNLGR